MKNILSILLVSMILFGCGENRVLIDELMNKGTDTNPILYYESKLFNGTGYDIYPSGQLKYEGNYKDGKKHGLSKSYHPPEQPWDDEDVFTDDSGHVHWSGPATEDDLEENLQDYPKGQLEYEGNYKEGKEEGVHKQWHQDGQLYSEGNYKEGKQEGLWEWWYQNGSIWREENYKDGKKEGLHKRWHQNGQLYSEGNYKEGKQEGLWEWWYKNGQLNSRETIEIDNSDRLYPK